MSILTLDFETYYDKLYSLSKMTTEEYVRDDRFEVIGVGIKVDDAPTEWFSGDYEEIKRFLSKYDWVNSFVLAHNTMFDGAILSWRFGISPKAWFDTLSMARALHGAEAGNSLSKLAQRYEIGEKGNEVMAAIGKHRADFSVEELDRYGEYCKNDVELTHKLFHLMRVSYAASELKLIDQTLRMFTHPVLELDLPLLEQHHKEVLERKEALMAAVQSNRKELLSNNSFAALLTQSGVMPPVKISPTTGQTIFAFAKNDPEFKALADHQDERVQALVAARTGTKSTLEETRTSRFIGIAKRGTLAVPLSYYAAHTGRWGGADKLNLQNLPRKSKLKSAICAPDGYMLVDADSSQIEARTLAWLSGQKDLVDAFEKGEDVYKIMASSIYGKPVEGINDAERFVGKTTILGAGYGMGPLKFQTQLASFNVSMHEEMCRHILRVYRNEFPWIPRLWEQASACLDALASQQLKAAPFGAQPQAISLLPGVGFDLPNKMILRYNDLKKTPGVLDGFNKEYIYVTRFGPVRVYGGKVVENICQALARCIIGEQLLRVAKRYKVALTVHDAITCVVPKDEVHEAAKYVRDCMRWRPAWAETLPLNCEVKYGSRYGETVKFEG